MVKQKSMVRLTVPPSIRRTAEENSIEHDPMARRRIGKSVFFDQKQRGHEVMRSSINPFEKCIVFLCTRFSLIAFLCLLAQLVSGESAQHEESDLPITPLQVGTPERIEVSPSKFTISGPRDQLQLVVTGYYANGEIADLTRAATPKFSSQGIAEGGERCSIKPLNDGITNVTVSVGGCSTSMSLIVTNQKSKEPVSFIMRHCPHFQKQVVPQVVPRCTTRQRRIPAFFVGI